MRKIFKLLMLTIIITSIMTPSAFAAKREKEVPEENFAYIEGNDSYWAKFIANHPDYVFDFIAGIRLGDYTVSGFVKYDEKMVADRVYWVNPEQIIIPGPQVVQIKAIVEGEEVVLTGEIVGTVSEALIPTSPSLTATTVTLNTLTTYDINLDNKISGSSYRWTSSNPGVAKVNAKNGLVTAVSEGEALITCEVTLPDNTIQELQSLVIVGYDENAPVLTETVLDLEVGDKFDINLENKIAKSKYRWVSSDRSVVKVNSSNGIVTAMGPGQAYVTCTITTPDKQIIVLRCDINVDAPSAIAE